MTLPTRYRVILALATVVVLTSCSGIPDRISFNDIDASVIRGPDHCEWDDTWLLRVGEEGGIGEPNDTNPDLPGHHMFVRNPTAVPEYSFRMPEELDRSRPSDAERLATSDDGFELWYSPSDSHYIYLVRDNFREAWVRATNWGLCA